MDGEPHHYVHHRRPRPPRRARGRARHDRRRLRPAQPRVGRTHRSARPLRRGPRARRPVPRGRLRLRGSRRPGRPSSLGRPRRAARARRRRPGHRLTSGPRSLGGRGGRRGRADGRHRTPRRARPGGRAAHPRRRRRRHGPGRPDPSRPLPAADPRTRHLPRHPGERASDRDGRGAPAAARLDGDQRRLHRPRPSRPGPGDPPGERRRRRYPGARGHPDAARCREQHQRAAAVRVDGLLPRPPTAVPAGSRAAGAIPESVGRPGGLLRVPATEPPTRGGRLRGRLRPTSAASEDRLAPPPAHGGWAKGTASRGRAGHLPAPGMWRYAARRPAGSRRAALRRRPPGTPPGPAGRGCWRSRRGSRAVPAAGCGPPRRWRGR